MSRAQARESRLTRRTTPTGGQRRGARSHPRRRTHRPRPARTRARTRRRRWRRKEEREAEALLFAAFFTGACLSGLSLQRYWNDAFALARSVVGQVERLPAPSNVFVRNLPREFRGGPYVLKCYAFPIYIAGRRGRAPEFRCDSVALERRGTGSVEAGPREPDAYCPHRPGDAMRYLSSSGARRRRRRPPGHPRPSLTVSVGGFAAWAQ